MKWTPRARTTLTNLSESAYQQLSTYALAAGAAGVSILALAQRAEAKIVYTPVSVVIDSTHPYNLDLNHDGTTDFSIFFTTMSPCEYKHLQENPTAGNAAVSSAFFAAALSSGASIGKGENFSPKDLIMAKDQQCARTFYGPWWNVSDRYLGLLFQVQGRIHFGWARLNVNIYFGRGPWHVTLTGYALETIPGKPIRAGQIHGAADAPSDEDFGPDASLVNPIPDASASLGVLALGVHGIPMWRRKEADKFAPGVPAD